MNKEWDNFSDGRAYQEWCMEWAETVSRVLKPGGHLLAFGGNTNHHRLFTGVEDAGYEIRETITWHYGSGFPKALDVSKAIDKQKDKTPLQEFRKKLEERRQAAGVAKRKIREHFDVDSRLVTMWMGETDDPQATSPTPEQWRELRDLLDATDLDADWQAWRNKVGKPSPDWFDREVVGSYEKAESFEYDGNRVYETEGDKKKIEIDITEPATDAAERWDGFKTALKPATEYVVLARKPLSEGTVAENVLKHGTGALNIDGTRIGTDVDTERPAGDMSDTQDKYGHYEGDQTNGSATGGRYPSNVVFDATEAERLDAEVGELDAGGHPSERNTTGYSGGLKQGDTGHERRETDSGGPSRYFYTSKASKAERTLDGKIDNSHPTVKPIDLMEWLVTLVTAEEQTVLDPFTGSGTTGIACKNKNRQFIGIEQNPEYADLARVRCGLDPEDPSVVRESDAQNGLEDY